MEYGTIKAKLEVALSKVRFIAVQEGDPDLLEAATCLEEALSMMTPREGDESPTP